MPFSKSNNRHCPDWLLARPIAHRGLHDIRKGVPENSSAAFSLAINQGLPIELDLQLSRDGHPVVMHDSSLLRTTGKDADVSALPLADILALPLEGTEERVPSFRQLLSQVAGQVPLVIELKPAAAPKTQYIEAVLKDLGGYDGPFAVQSFNPFLLMELRRQRPDIIRGQLGYSQPPKHLNAFRKRLVRHMPLHRYAAPDYIAYDVAGLSSARIRRLRRRGLPILAWTVDSTEKIRLARAGADNFIYEKLSLDEF